MEATVHLPGEGEQIGGPTTVTIKATGEETNNSFYLGESVVEPGFRGRPHMSTSTCTTCSMSWRGR
jgi:hypothetical protein